MPDFLTSALADGPAIPPLVVAARLIGALALGWIVAWTYRHTRDEADVSPTFPTTLVLLAILIAMVTQVIGDNVARAFSLVGALSIVRFRTVVRDTRDTAFVIFAVVVGMAVGANDPWVAVIGLGTVGAAAALMRPSSGATAAGVSAEETYLLAVRMSLGVDLESTLGRVLDSQLQHRDLRTVRTARQGIAIEVVYSIRLAPDCSAGELVKSLNRIDGVQSVDLNRDSAKPV